MIRSKDKQQAKGISVAALWALIAAILLLPLVAMQFTGEVAWTGSDFAAAALLLCVSAAIFHLVVRRMESRKKRIMLGAALVAAVAAIWAEGAVGLF